MRVLSIKQPWLWLLLHGYKSIEVRTWKPKDLELPCPILLHASKSVDEWAMKYFKQILESKSQFPVHLGAVCGVAQLVSFRDYQAFEEFEKDKMLHLNQPDWFNKKNIGWVFDKIIPFKEPVAMKGKLNLFNAKIVEEG